MPEMTFEVRWPDGVAQQCYSPSLVMHDYLHPDSAYTVSDFVQRCDRALTEASSRVRARYGFACTSAAATAEQIQRAAARYPADAQVRVTAMTPALESS